MSSEIDGLQHLYCCYLVLVLVDCGRTVLWDWPARYGRPWRSRASQSSPGSSGRPRPRRMNSRECLYEKESALHNQLSHTRPHCSTIFCHPLPRKLKRPHRMIQIVQHDSPPPRTRLISSLFSVQRTLHRPYSHADHARLVRMPDFEFVAGWQDMLELKAIGHFPCICTPSCQAENARKSHGRSDDKDAQLGNLRCEAESVRRGDKWAASVDLHG